MVKQVNTHRSKKEGNTRTVEKGENFFFRKMSQNVNQEKTYKKKCLAQDRHQRREGGLAGTSSILGI